MTNFLAAAAAAVFCSLAVFGSSAAHAGRPAHLPAGLIVGAEGGDPLALAARASAASGIQIRYERQLANGGYLFQLPPFSQPVVQELARKALRALPGVSYVDEDLWLTPRFSVDDPRFMEQWHYHEAVGGIRLPTAWDITKGSGINVAVLDTGYRPHADLAPNLIGGYDFINSLAVANDGNGRDADALDPGDSCNGAPSSWHGTHVAGTIAAVANNGLGVAGVAFKSRIVPVRVIGTCGGVVSDIVDGIIWAAGGNVPGVPVNANPVKVMNLSLGGAGACGSALQGAIDAARGRGASVVVAAGNANRDAGGEIPANCAGVIAVAATARNGGKASYSNYGSVVDLAAPGGQTSVPGNGVLSTLNSGSAGPGGDSYGFLQGTSMAAPHVAGVAALMYARQGSLKPDEIESRLKSTARPFPAPCSGCGAGIVDATAALSPPVADSTPDAFSFPTRKNVAPGSLAVSKAVTITGLGTAAALGVEKGEYSIGCSGTFTTAPGSISNGQSVCLRHVAAGQPDTVKKTTLTIGGVSGSFKSRTAAAAGAASADTGGELDAAEAED